MKNTFKLSIVIVLCFVFNFTFSQKRINYERVALDYLYNHLDSLKGDNIDSLFFDYRSVNIFQEDFFLQNGYLKRNGFISPLKILPSDSIINKKIINKKNSRIRKIYLDKIFYTKKVEKINLVISRRFYFGGNIYIKIIIKESSFKEKFILIKYSDTGEL
ncbi:MAG: hypothetical protein NTZ59_09720, partial [Bacteroidetes bacterium]|nr:hypothetical protein [Bacteroidota bacterium]